MTDVSGVDVPVLQAISNFVITSGLRPGGPGDRPGVDHWSPIPPITFSLADATFNSDATISWGPQADTLGRGNILSGWDWAFLSPILTYPEFDIDHDPDTFPATNYCLISFFRLATFWPVDGGANQSNVNGDWVFVGTAVPEAGGTLGYLALGLVLLSATQLRRKI
jgi:hypothetical protein